MEDGEPTPGSADRSTLVRAGVAGSLPCGCQNGGILVRHRSVLADSSESFWMAAIFSKSSYLSNLENHFRCGMVVADSRKANTPGLKRRPTRGCLKQAGKGTGRL